MYRLGSFASSSLLNIHPDITVHAKLLTGGLVPLCTTTTSDSIYEAFLGDEKSDALLHGHSYTAHAVGCEVARTSVQWMLDMDRRGDWDQYKDDWVGRSSTSEISASSGLTEICPADVKIWSVWGRNFVSQISQARQVESVVAVGTVLAISLKDDNAGYTSTAANGLQKLLLEREAEQDANVHSRVLGNVLYLMTSLTTEAQTVKLIEERLVKSLFL
jgi:bifunctional dethiobiotin synthetase / adenosylmethionine---8-amino-7-oxononanoate aminotransferase